MVLLILSDQVVAAGIELQVFDGISNGEDEQQQLRIEEKLAVANHPGRKPAQDSRHHRVFPEALNFHASSTSGPTEYSQVPFPLTPTLSPRRGSTLPHTEIKAAAI